MMMKMIKIALSCVAAWLLPVKLLRRRSFDDDDDDDGIGRVVSAAADNKEPWLETDTMLAMAPLIPVANGS
jgi:hypothetical protein